MKAQDLGYQENTNLMLVETGSVQTAKEWMDESKDWDFGDEEYTIDQIQQKIEEVMNSMVEVKKDSNGDWIEIK
jgi:hypothetical protein